MNPPEEDPKRATGQSKTFRAFCTEFFRTLRRRGMVELILLPLLFSQVACNILTCSCDQSPELFVKTVKLKGSTKTVYYRLDANYLEYADPAKDTDLSVQADWKDYYTQVPPPGSDALERKASVSSTAAASVRVPAIAVVAVDDNAYDSANITNLSYGPFTSQVAVSYHSPRGLVGGRSAGALGFETYDYSYLLRIDARCDPLNHGFLVCAVTLDTTNMVEIDVTKPVSFPDTNIILLRMQLTGTNLVLYARPPNSDWTTIYTADYSPPAVGFWPYLGVSVLNKGGTIYFLKARADGAGIGGMAEGPINLMVRDSIAAIASAENEIFAATPDLTGAETYLNTAMTSNSNAIIALNSAITSGSLQATTHGAAALAALQSAGTQLNAAAAVVATMNVRNAQNQQPILDGAVFNQNSAMSSLLGGPSFTTQMPTEWLNFESGLFLPFFDQ